jgi:photosystem II stability/assembly factor-like uncharacterized protein
MSQTMTRRVIWYASFFMLASSAAAPAHAAGALPYSALQWRSIGPAISGGRATAIAGTDDDPFLYYIGTAGGGVFRSRDGGAHWDDVWSKQPVGPIGAVAIAPHHADVVWVGTGESNPRNDVSYGNGVYVSRNGGKSWRHVGLDATSQISRILIDPRDPNTVLVAALGDPFADSQERGVYRTTDGGKTWAKTLYVGPGSGASDLAWNSSKPNVVFAGVWQYRRTGWSGASGGPQDGLYRSTDAGLKWTKLTAHGLPESETGRIGVAVAPNDANRVYAVIESRQGLLWRSDDGGSTWRLMSADTIMDQRPFYYSHVFVDATNQDHVLAVSVHLAESRDGGKTWKRISAIHGDHHDIWWAADGRRIANANDGGTAISIDGAKSWEWRNNYASGQIYRVAYDLDVPYTVCVGLQDNDGWCGPSADGSGGITDRDWVDVGGGDSTWVVPDPIDNRIVWVAAGGGNNGGELGLYDRRSGQFTDVSPYLRDTNGMGTADLPYRFNWESPLAFSPQNPHVAYFGGNVVWRTADRGKHWAAISPDLTLDEKLHQQASGGLTHDVTGAETFDTILSIAPSPVEAGVIWVGTDDGLVQLTRDGGRHWSKVTPAGIGPYGRVATIDASLVRGSEALAIVDRHYTGDRAPYIVATNDFGATWHSLSAGLPKNQFVRTVRQDPRNSNVLYAGLEQGVWISFDRGTSWQSLQLNLPAASVRDLRIHPRDNDLIAATHGRSAWILDDVTPLQELDRAKKAGTYFFQPRAAYELVGGPSGTPNGGPSSFSGDARDYGALLSYYLSKPAKSTSSIDVIDAQGRTLRRMSGTHDEGGKQVPDVPGDAGVNRLAWDLNYDAPTSWKGAPKWNRDAISPAPVAPGTYTIVLHIDGRSLVRKVDVRADPHAPWTQADEAAWRATMLEIASRMSSVDDMLNALDALDKNLDARASQAQGNARLADMIAVVRTAASSVRAALTSNPKNDQDDDFLPDMLRERLQSLWGSMDGARTPPTQADLDELEALGSVQAAASASYARLMNAEVSRLDTALKAAGLQPVR